MVKRGEELNGRGVRGRRRNGVSGCVRKRKRASERRQRGVREVSASGHQIVRAFVEFSSYELGLTSLFVVLRASE